MIKRFFSFIITLLFSTTGGAAVCLLPSPNTPLAFNTTFAGGPTMVAIAIGNPGVGAAIAAGRDAWDVTDAAGFIGNWNGATSASDCPANLPLQLGAMGFFGSNCPTILGYGLNGNFGNNVLAFVDFNPGACLTCGTNSLVVNLNHAWSLNPLPGQHDIQQMFAHEFGHMLGIGHQRLGVCTNAASPSCTASPNIETMGATLWPGDTCLRTLNNTDIQSADWLY